MTENRLEGACAAIAAVCICLGVLGMVLSFFFLASGRSADLTAGMSGFIAGSVLIAGGLISLTLIAIRP